MPIIAALYYNVQCMSPIVRMNGVDMVFNSIDIILMKMEGYICSDVISIGECLVEELT